MTTQKERTVGVWRRSVWSGGFWWRTIVTLGLYVILLWRRNQITLTTHRVTQRRGNVLGGSETSINLENITDVNINKSALGTILGYSTIRIQSAGTSDAEIKFEGLADADDLRDAIFDLQDGSLDEKPKSGD